MRSKKEIRAAVLEKHDDCRITKTGDVLAKGRMPNSTSYGWFLLGVMGSAEFDAALFSGKE